MISKRFMLIASALAPNYTKKDIVIALQELLLPWRWKQWQEGKETEQLEKQFTQYFNKPHAISFANGRSGLYAILKALNIQPGDEVILQAFTTVALPNTIQHIGAKPIFVDIEKDSFNINPTEIEAKITPNTKAIIIQHTFGNPAKLTEILNIAKKYQLATIEDCAHSLGVKYNHTLTGNFADAAFFSLGRDKNISSSTGGMVITSNIDLAVKIKEYRNLMTHYPKKNIAQYLAHPIITTSALFSYHCLSIGKLILWLSNKIKLTPKAYSTLEKDTQMDMNHLKKMPNTLAKLALNQMQYISQFNQHRQDMALYYKRRINNPQIEQPLKNSPAQNVFLWYTILTNQKNTLLQTAKQHNIILGNWFPQVVGPENINLNKINYQIGSCPVAEEVSAKCVNLPTHHNISKQQADKIIHFLNNFKS